jgi:hypothetical protein
MTSTLRRRCCGSCNSYIGIVHFLILYADSRNNQTDNQHSVLQSSAELGPT